MINKEHKKYLYTKAFGRLEIPNIKPDRTICIKKLALILSLLLGLIPSVSFGDWLYFFDRELDVLYRKNMNTWETEKIGPVGFNYRYGGMAWDPKARKLLVVNDATSVEDLPDLYAIDPFTAVAEKIGTIQHDLPLQRYSAFGLAYDENSERLYLSHQKWVMEVN